MAFDTVFLDRDGVMNRDPDPSWVLAPADLELLPGAAEAVAQLNRAGLTVLVVTNQSCVGRGLCTLADIHRVHAELHRLLAAGGARVDGIYTCPHAPEDLCACRKPRPGLLLQAAARHRIDFARAVVVGDRLTDLELARRAGCRSVLVRTGHGNQVADPRPPPDHIAADLAAAVDWILARCVSS